MNEKDILISLFIDDEMNIDEKKQFVKEINSDDDFCADTLDMLQTEQTLYNLAEEAPPVPVIRQKEPFSIASYVSFAALAVSLMVMVKVFLMTPETSVSEHMQRFVIYVPDAGQVSVAGSFNGWQPVRMQKTDGGYWQVLLPLKNGEYAYSYIIDGVRQMPDPTTPARQDDGFGGENSVITVGDKI
ncbi:MAG: isoamylase early set domain-containing protein [Deferribacterales bacterium]